MTNPTDRGKANWDSNAFQEQNTIKAMETYVDPMTGSLDTPVDVQGIKDLEVLRQEQEQQQHHGQDESRLLSHQLIQKPWSRPYPMGGFNV